MPGQFRFFLKRTGRELAAGTERRHPADETESGGGTGEAKGEAGGQASAGACAFDGEQGAPKGIRLWSVGRMFGLIPGLVQGYKRARWPDGRSAPRKKQVPPSGALRCPDLDGVSEAPRFGVAQQLATALFNKPPGDVGIQLDLRQLGLHYGAASSSWRAARRRRAPRHLRRHNEQLLRWNDSVRRPTNAEASGLLIRANPQDSLLAGPHSTAGADARRD